MIGYAYRWDHKYDQHPIYIGSCKDDKHRERKHRNDYNNPNTNGYTKPFYKHVRKYGTIEDWNMTVIYKGPDFKIFEKNYIKSTWEYNSNKELPLQTKQEMKDRKQAIRKAYRVANREKINAKQRAYIKANIDILNEKRKEKIPCNNCGDIIRKTNLARHKKSKTCMAFK